MNSSHSTTTKYKKGATGIIISSITLLLILVGIGSIIYSFNRNLDYTWRWHKVAYYFLHQEVVEIRTGAEGIVQSIKAHDDETIISIKRPLTF